jgi:phage portal protein BeeE
MLAWLKERVGSWFAGSAPATSAPAAPATKGKTRGTLTDYIGGSSGFGSGLSTPLNDARALAMNRNWVHACVRVIAQRIAARSVRVGRVAGGKPGKGTKAASAHPPWMRPGDVKELTAHPLLDAIHDPNPYAVSWSLVYLLVASLELTGRAYVWADTEGDALRLWFIPSHWVTPDPDAKLPLTRFVVSPGNSGRQFRLTSDELLLIQLPNPADPLAPLSPLAAGW